MRCFETFQDVEERDLHLRMTAQCPVRERKTWDGISENQSQQLKKRVSRTNSTEENWYLVYEVLFPNSQRPKSPCTYHASCLLPLSVVIIV